MTYHMLPYVRSLGDQNFLQGYVFQRINCPCQGATFTESSVSLCHGAHVVPHRPFNQGCVRHYAEQMSQEPWWYRLRGHFAATLGIFSEE